MSQVDNPPASQAADPATKPATATPGPFLSAEDAVRRAKLAGVIAVAVAVGLGELLAGLLDGVPSLIASVGSFVVDATPPWLEDLAIRVFGTSDKLVLNVIVALVTLAFGRAIGAAALRRFDRGAIGLVVLGIVGTLASLTQPLTAAALVVIVGILITAASLGSLRRMLAAIEDVIHDPADGSPKDKRLLARAAAGRREFLGLAGGLGVASLVGVIFGRSLLTSGGRTGADGFTLAMPDSGTTTALPVAASFESIEGLTPIVVPNSEFYRIDTALIVPRVDAATWSMRIHGLVDREVTLTLDDINAMPLIEQPVTIACVSNEVGGDLVGNAVWRGVLLRDLLDMAGVQDGASQVVGRSVDGWTGGFPLEAAFDERDAMLAIGMNGEPLPVAHGFPARLIVPGLYGYVSATKWLSDIEVTTWEGFDGYWVPRGWSKIGPVKTQSRIDVPRSGQRVTAGPVVVAGVAWAPTLGIDLVEVRLNEGPWVEAELSEPLSEDAWVQWKVAIEAPAGNHLVQVRATDASGFRQTPEFVAPRPDGAEGWHTIRISAT